MPRQKTKRSYLNTLSLFDHTMTKVPAGIMVFVVLHSFAVMIFIIHAIISIPFILVNLVEDSGLAGLAVFEIFWSWIMLSISGAIVGGLLYRKEWARTFVMALAGISLVVGFIDLVSGNMFAVFAIIIDGIIISYMRKPHIIEWFNV